MTRFSNEDLELVKYFDIIKDTELEPFVFHIANERGCSFQEGRRLKRKGVKAGVLDVFHMIPNENYNGLWIEFKSASGKVSKEQSKFMTSALSQGYFVNLVYSSDEALVALLTYIKNTSFGCSFLDSLPTYVGKELAKAVDELS